MIDFIAMLAGTATIDFAWARYIRAVADRNGLAAITWSGAITGISGLVVLGYVQNHWLLIPAVLGAALGTALGMDHGSNR